MIHRNVDYKKSPAPAFDAVQDVMDWFGEKYDTVAKDMRHVKNPRQFSFLCSFGGVEGFPVKCWYEHFHGQGAWDKAWAEVEPEDTTNIPIED